MIEHLKASKAIGTLVVPEWYSAVFWPLLFSDNSPYKGMVRDTMRFKDPEHIFVQGRNSNSIFGTSRMNSAVLCIRLMSNEI